MTTAFISALPLLLILVFLLVRSPDKCFWLSLFFFFDPGGFFEGYFDSKLIGLLNFSDVLFFMILLSIILQREEKSSYRQDRRFRFIFRYTIFFLLYFVLIYGLIIPYYYERIDVSFFLIKNRNMFYSIFLMYGVFKFSDSIGVLYKHIKWFSLIILILYFLTILANIPIVPIVSMERYSWSSIQRLSMIEYGMIEWILYIGLILFFVRQTKNDYGQVDLVVYFASGLMFVALLLTLTRREYLGLVLSSLVISLLISHVFNLPKLKLLSKLIIPTIALIILIFAFLPNDIDNFSLIFKDTFSLLFTGQDTGGAGDYRLSGTGPLEYAKQIILENPIFGTGYIPYLWSDIEQLKNYGDTFASAIDASAEVPIYGAFFRFGIIGVIIASVYYYVLYKDLYGFLKRIPYFKDSLLRGNTAHLMMLLVTLFSLLANLLVRFYNVFLEFYTPSRFPLFVVTVALFYAMSFRSGDYFKNPVIKTFHREENARK